MAGSNKNYKRKRVNRPSHTIYTPTLKTSSTTTNGDKNLAVQPAAIINKSSSNSSSSSDSDDLSPLPPAAAAALNFDADVSSSASDKVRELLEPFSKEQLLDLIVEAAAKDSSLYQRINDMADADVAHRKLFVHGLCWNTTREDLFEAFGSYGEIEDINLVFDKITGKSRGFALFLYKTEDGAKKALAEPYKIFDSHQLHCQIAAEGKNKSSAAVAVNPVQTPVLSPMAATQNMLLNQYPGLNQMYGSMFGNPTAGFFPGAMNPLMMAGAFNPAMMQTTPMGVNGEMGLGAYGMMPNSMLPSFSPNPATQAPQQAYSISQTGQVHVQQKNGQSTSVREKAPPATFSSYLRKSWYDS